MIRVQNSCSESGENMAPKNWNSFHVLVNATFLVLVGFEVIFTQQASAQPSSEYFLGSGDLISIQVFDDGQVTEVERSKSEIPSSG